LKSPMPMVEWLSSRVMPVKAYSNFFRILSTLARRVKGAFFVAKLRNRLRI
jgi:hypothetical protein